MHLRFPHVLSQLAHSSLAALGKMPLSGQITVYVSVPLLKDIWLAPSLGNCEESCYKYIGVDVFSVHLDKHHSLTLLGCMGRVRCILKRKKKKKTVQMPSKVAIWDSFKNHNIPTGKGKD